MSESVGRVEIPRQLEHLSLAEIKALRRRSAESGKRVGAPPLVPQQRDNSVPLSFAQERLWFLDQLGLLGPTYNVAMALRLEGQLNVPALEHSFAELVRRHECLRMRVKSTASGPIQVIDPPGPFLLGLRDISKLEEEKSLAIQRLTSDEARVAFDLTSGPLLRASLLRVNPQEHVLLLTIHHIIFDGWSEAVLYQELSELYDAYSRGLPSPLPALPVQYGDYAIWQRQWLEGDVLQRQLQYWRECLAGAPPQLELPTDRPRPPTASFTGGRLSFVLSPSLRQSLTALERNEGVTFFMVMLAAYQVLLLRYSGQEDIVVGSPIAGRTHALTEGLIGFFANMLVLRSDLSGNPTFRQLLGRIKEVTLSAYAHQDLPFEKLVAELQPERSLTRHPVFQVALALENFPQEPFQFRGLTWTWVDAERTTARFDLALYLTDSGHGCKGTFEYATDIFDQQTIERMSQGLQTLLKQIVADCNRPIIDLPILSDLERCHVLKAFNATQTEYPREALLHELFEAQVIRTPDAIAVVSEGEALTYADLNGKANQLARHLLESGMQIGEYVPILISRGLSMLVAQLAVLKVGGTYVPMDPNQPAERHAFMIRDCGARRVLAASECAEQPESVKWINCCQALGPMSGLYHDNLCLPTSAPPPAYVMYTSGSTGTPKGVAVPHRAVIRLIINNGYAQLEPSDRIAHCSNPAFDASTFEVWGALLNGARVVIVPQSVLLDAERFANVLKTQHVTVLFLTTGLFTQYADTLMSVFAQLRYLLVGGDVVDPGAVRCVLRNSPAKHLLNAYGPTETTTFATIYRIESIAQDAKSVPIGRPISNTQVYILDSALTPVPIGVAGEIYIGGIGVALGYLNRPELTAARFIADPYSADPGARLYKTGDMGKWRANGEIEYLGRSDHQVKIRGFRIELGEIEARLLRHVRVKEAVVLAREDTPGEKRLVAYVVPRDSVTEPPSVEALLTYLRDVLPEYMVPSAFVLMHGLPLTPNGKLDRHALPAPDLAAYLSRQFEAPQGEVEHILAGIWQAQLHVERIGRQDNFFELGGHSLLGLSLVKKVAERFGARLSAVAIFQYPTLQQMAAIIEASRSMTTRPVTSGETEIEEGVI